MRKNVYSLQNEQNDHKTFARQERSKSVRQRVTSYIGDRQCALCGVQSAANEQARTPVNLSNYAWLSHADSDSVNIKQYN